MNDLSWTPPVGHNQPPLDLAGLLNSAAVEALLGEKFAQHRDRVAQLLGADHRFSEATKDGIPDDDTAAKATDFVRQLKAAAKAVDDCRTEIKAPVLAAQRQIDGAAKLLTDPLSAATTRAESRVKAYLRQKEAEARARAEEEARLREEEARRLIAEAEAAQQAEVAAGDVARADTAEIVATEKAVAAIDAAEEARRAAQASAADLSRTRTTLGGVASLRQNWTFEITDKMALLRAVVAGEAPADYVLPNDSLLKALAKSQKDNAKVAGVRFFNDAGVTIR